MKGTFGLLFAVIFSANVSKSLKPLYIVDLVIMGTTDYYESAT